MFMNYASVCNPYSGFSAPVNGTSATECAEKALFSGLSRHVLHYGLGIKDGRKIDQTCGTCGFISDALDQIEEWKTSNRLKHPTVIVPYGQEINDVYNAPNG